MTKVKDFEEKQISSKIPSEWGDKTTASDIADAEDNIILHDAELIREDDGGKKLYAISAELEKSKKRVWFFTASENIIRNIPEFPIRAKLVWRKSQKTRQRYIALAPPQ